MSKSKEYLPGTKFFNMQYMLHNQANKEFVFNEAINLIDNFLCHSIHSFASGLCYTKKDDIKKILELTKLGHKILVGRGGDINDNSRIYYKLPGKDKLNFFVPRAGIVIFMQSCMQFYVYVKHESDDKKSGYFWRPINNNDENCVSYDLTTSINVRESFEISSNLDLRKDDIFAKYQKLNQNTQNRNIAISVNEDVEIIISDNYLSSFKLFITYNSGLSCKIKWSKNIIWPIGNEYKMTFKDEAISIKEYMKINNTNVVKQDTLDIIEFHSIKLPSENNIPSSSIFIGKIIQSGYPI